MRQRLYDLKRQSGLYRYLPNDGLCCYCGESEECQDHFLPLSMACCMEDTMDVSSGKYLLPSCLECNLIAGAKIFDSFKEKFEYIQDRIFASEVDPPDEELVELGYTLRTTFIAARQRNQRNRRRASWTPKYNANAEIAEISFTPIARGKSFVPGNVSNDGMKREEEKWLPTPEKDLVTIPRPRLRTKVDREFFRNIKKEFGEEAALKMMNDNTV